MNHKASQLILIVAIIHCLVPSHGRAAEDLNCLPENSPTFYSQLQDKAYAALDRRSDAFEALKTPADIAAYQKRLREFFLRQVGGFPEKTPLRPITVRTIDADGYRIENVMFESRPNHHVTANLYLPDGGGPFPGIVVASGHSRTGKTADYNQRFGIMMAKQGMAALCYDPIGQGERSQILGPDGSNRFPGTTTEHFLIGVGSILVGRNTASYEIWDAIRCVDYLESRPEIDATKIGMTGCSGGGTQTSYVMALEDRIVCAAPACYLTTFRRLIETIGPQDAEQNIYGQIAFGLDQPDYVLLRAPKPTLISATTEDFFDIGGSWQNFRQAKRVYGTLGRPEQIDLVETAGKHGVTPQNLATIAHWMRRWLLDRDEPVDALVFEPRPAEDLLSTKRGQVLLLPNERSVFELNAEYESILSARRGDLWDSLSPDALRTRIRTQIGASVSPPAVDARQVGSVSRQGYDIEKHVLETEAGVSLPALVFRPQKTSGEVCLYLHDEGKTGDAGVGGPIEDLVRGGTTVVSVDLRGQGETAARERDETLTDWKTFFLSYLMGQSLVGARVDDTIAAARFAAGLRDSGEQAVKLVGVGQSGIVALHAAAIHPARFSSVVVRDTPPRWSTLVSDPVPAGQLDHVVHAALEVYDLPNLVELAGPFIAAPWTEPGRFTSGIEGPACDRDGNLYAVSFGDERTIGRVTPAGRSEAWVELPEGSTGNGIRFAADGQMFVADYTGHNVLKIDPSTKQISVFAHESRMNQPNDLAIAEDGTLYASDPDWKAGDGALWRISTSGEVTLLGDGLGTTNGIEVSPDGETLYVAESRQRRVLAYELSPRGVSKPKTLIEFDHHSLDGMRCDVDGNLYLTRHGAGVVLKLSPSGEILRTIELPGSMPSNLCFGGPDGRTLYVTEVEHRQVLRLRVDRPGLSWHRQSNRKPTAIP